MPEPVLASGVDGSNAIDQHHDVATIVPWLAIIICGLTDGCCTKFLTLACLMYLMTSGIGLPAHVAVCCGFRHCVTVGVVVTSGLRKSMVHRNNLHSVHSRVISALQQVQIWCEAV